MLVSECAIHKISSFSTMENGNLDNMFKLEILRIVSYQDEKISISEAIPNCRDTLDFFYSATLKL